MERPDFSMRSVPKSAFGLMQKLSKCVRYTEEKRRKRKESFSLRRCNPGEEIERNTVRV